MSGPARPATRCFGAWLVALPLAIVSCASDDALSERLVRLAADHVDRPVDLAAATSFAWDEIAFFGPYVPKPFACSALGLSRWGCFRLPYPSADDDSRSLLVFMDRGDVAGTALLPRCKIEVSLREGSGMTSAKGSGRFMASLRAGACKSGVHRLVQE